MMAPPRVTQEEWQRRANAAGYDLLAPVVGSGAKVRVRCLECEGEASVWAISLTKGNGCRACAIRARSVKPRAAKAAAIAAGGKACTRCGEWKVFGEFHKDASFRDGHRPDCRACTNARNKEWYDANREAQLERKRAYNKANKDRLAAAKRDWYKRNRAQHAAYNRAKKYGITPEEYDALVAAAGGRCEICGRSQEDDGRDLNVDHDHETGKVRGLLCKRCNLALGYLGDDPALAARAADYLKSHERQDAAA